MKIESSCRGEVVVNRYEAYSWCRRLAFVRGAWADGNDRLGHARFFFAGFPYIVRVRGFPSLSFVPVPVLSFANRLRPSAYIPPPSPPRRNPTHPLRHCHCRWINKKKPHHHHYASFFCGLPPSICSVRTLFPLQACSNYSSFNGTVGIVLPYFLISFHHHYHYHIYPLPDAKTRMHMPFPPRARSRY